MKAIRQRSTTGWMVCALAAILISQNAARASAASASTPGITPVKDQRAVTELKRMSDTLSGAKTLSFDAASMRPIRGPNGQWFHVLTTAKVVMRRPDRLAVETGGDAIEQKIIFDGTNYSVSVPTHRLYSQTAMPGSIDTMLANASKKGGNVFTFADVLLSDPYAMWEKSLAGAIYIGESHRGTEKLIHLALLSKAVDWEIWMDAKSHLPRIVYVKYTGVDRMPSVMIEFSKWKLNAAVPASTFRFVAPKGAIKAKLRAPEGEQS